MELPQFVIKRVERKIRQRIFGGVIMSVALLMVLNSFGFLALGGTSLDINLTVSISGGAFSLDNGPTQMSFAAQTFGTGANVTGNVDVDNLAVTDYRGNSSIWSVAINANNFSDGTNQIHANKLTIYQDFRGFLTNIQNMATSRVALGSNGTLNDTGRTLINGSTQASGIVQFDNGFVNFFYNGADPAGTYGAKLFLTLS